MVRDMTVQVQAAGDVTAEGAPHVFVSAAAVLHEPKSYADVVAWLLTTLMHHAGLSFNSQCVLSRCCKLLCWRRHVLKDCIFVR